MEMERTNMWQQSSSRWEWLYRRWTKQLAAYNSYHIILISLINEAQNNNTSMKSKVNVTILEYNLQLTTCIIKRYRLDGPAF
jgi:hypothetical protein